VSRPAVEAGERLGFLPGDIQAKVDPYLRPLFDALYDMLDPEKVLTFQHCVAGKQIDCEQTRLTRYRPRQKRCRLFQDQ
jgi:phosphate starvation-inducible protein PhoH